MGSNLWVCRRIDNSHLVTINGDCINVFQLEGEVRNLMEEAQKNYNDTSHPGVTKTWDEFQKEVNSLSFLFYGLFKTGKSCMVLNMKFKCTCPPK